MGFFKDLSFAAIQERATDGIDYNDYTVRGVNLGGWFVLEPWITPSIFEPYANGGGVVDEYTLSATLGTSAAQSLLEQHWGSWITEDDFAQIAAAGLNTVRIPIGYWAFVLQDGDPYVTGAQLPYLATALGWARTHGLKVLLDLHGAPESQNGFDNSGRLGPVQWQTGNTVQTTRTAITNLTDFAVDNNFMDVVTSIELLNEPAGFSPNINLDVLKQFYYDGYGYIQSQTPDTLTVIHDAFQDIDSYWNGFMNSATGVSNVMLDTHIYQVFTPAQLAQTPCQHVSNACSNKATLAGTDKWTIVGEWTGAQTDCAKWLNGLGTGARYDGTFTGSGGSYYIGDCATKDVGTVAGMEQVDKTNLQYYVEAQLDAYETHSGWIFWCWKTESAPEWNFQDLLNNGLIPQPITSRKFAPQCNGGACIVPG
ncbi:glycoside hydrolase family 5 protein [Hyaloscypha variabilis F]|uniref:glucan 1,3-beta-glucosidase n=1 Tax=Hyaloscypha variabilis (strain UAMH 11265 / GT02V1 / F) TaxID=1149755 RepID=A0A2J6RIK7_HYAVF|nr:glycoside hydrolase family 5 protein [Hyaloscypha variabilis F]